MAFDVLGPDLVGDVSAARDQQPDVPAGIARMKEKNISRNSLAQRMKTSRSQIGRLLDPKEAMSP